MNAQAFAAAREAFAARLARLMELRPPVVSGDIDARIQQVSSAVNGEEDTTSFLVEHIAADNRKILDNMQGHALENIPDDVLFARPYESDAERTGRYELIAALMVDSGFPAKLLYSGRRWAKRRFDSSSEFFRTRGMGKLNEQCISLGARRLLCFYGPISNVPVPGQELRDLFATSNDGMTTQDVFRRELTALQRGTY